MNGMSSEALRALVVDVRSMAPATDDSERVDRLRLLEELKAIASAEQLRLAVELDASVRAAERAAGVRYDRRGRGVASQLGLALRRSPWAAQRWLWHAKIITADLPGTFAALAAGRTTEWRALLVAREAAVLSPADRAAVDAEIADQLEEWGDRRVEGETRRRAQRLDPEAAVKRARKAVADRRVTMRPAPDAMCRLSALLPVAQGVAAYAALSRHADTAASDTVADRRGRGQLMADTLVERLTGQQQADAVPVEINLVMSTASLLGREGEPGRDEPALIAGHGPIPADIARELAGVAGGAKSAPRWLRRLFVLPAGGQLVAMETRRRRFTAAQCDFIALRDQTCRTPWCDAPVRHIDHVTSHADGGPTSVGNAQGLCEACNYAKESPGWHVRAARDGTVVELRAPTGHRYRSRAPDLPRSPVELDCARLLTAVA